MYKIEKFRSEKNKEHYFRVVAENGNIICSSEGYKNKKDRNSIADNFAINMLGQFAEDSKENYAFSNIGDNFFATYDRISFFKRMNNLGWFKFPMYKIYTDNDGDKTYFLNKEKNNSPYFNFAEKETMIEWSKTHTPKISRIEEVNVEDFKKEMEG